MGGRLMAAPMEKTRHAGIYKRGSRYVAVWQYKGQQHKLQSVVVARRHVPHAACLFWSSISSASTRASSPVASTARRRTPAK
jgi:hypothetical protein